MKVIQRRIDKIPQSKDLNEHDFKTSNDTIPLKRAVLPNMKFLEVTDTGNTESGKTSQQHASRPTIGATGGTSGNGNVGNGGNGGNGPPFENKDEIEPEGDKDCDRSEENRRIEDEREREKEEQNKKNEEEESLDEPEDIEEQEPSKFKQGLAKIGKFLFKCLEIIGITFSSIAILGVAGLLYHRFYGIHVLDKMDLAFEKGDPAFQLSMHKRTNKNTSNAECDGDDLSQYWVQRPQ